MKRILRNSVLSIIALAATVLTVPAQAQSWGQANDGGRRSGTPQQASWDRNREDHGGRDRRDYGRRDYDRDERRDYDYRGGYVASGPYVQPGYAYYGDGYGYGYRDSREGRSAAIIGGSAVAGALIGGAAGHGQGAVVGAVVGGIAGVIADQAVRHHDYR